MLPPGWIPADNPLTPAKVELGRRLFFDPRLSRGERLSCASCHKPAFGWADPRSFSVGVDGVSGTRNAPSVLNRGLARLQFRDGRAASLEAQALGPIGNPIEMGSSPEAACESLNRDPEMRERFVASFGGPATPERLAKALASYERTLLAGGAPVDGTDPAGMSPAARRGQRIFQRSACQRCHQGPTFSDEAYHNLGVGMSVPSPDLGRFGVTGRDVDRGAFRTPSLRNVSVTAPYMHDGSLESLEEVVEFYDRGGNPNPWLSPLVGPLGLTPAEKADLVAFLAEGLTGDVPEALAPTRE